MIKWWPKPVVVPLLAKEDVCGIGLGGCHHHYPSSSDLRHHHFSSIIFVSSQMKIKNKICVFSGYLLMKLVPNFTMLWPRSPHLPKHWALQFNSHPILQTTPLISKYFWQSHNKSSKVNAILGRHLKIYKTFLLSIFVSDWCRFIWCPALTQFRCCDSSSQTLSLSSGKIGLGLEQ